MAISTNAAIEFFGTQDTVTSSSSAVTDGSYSVQADITAWTNDDDAPGAVAILQAAYSLTPTAGTFVYLFARLLNIQSTNDAATPQANFEFDFLGAFPILNTTSTQYIPIEIGLPNTKSGQEYEFYIRNDAGQTLSAGWELYITPKTIGPHA